MSLKFPIENLSNSQMDKDIYFNFITSKINSMIQHNTKLNNYPLNVLEENNHLKNFKDPKCFFVSFLDNNLFHMIQK